MWYVTSSQICLPFIVFCGTINRSDIVERIQCSPNSRNLLVYKLLLLYVYIFFKSACYRAHGSEYIQYTTSVSMSSVLLYNIVNSSKGNQVPESYSSYSNPMVVPFEYFTHGPEVTDFSHVLTDKKAVLPQNQLAILSGL